jgi:hypothetical protein
LSFQVSHQVGRKARLRAALNSKIRFNRNVSTESAGKASVGVAALPGASACKLWQERREQRCWERVTGRGSYTPHQALHSQNNKAEKAFQNIFEKTRRGFEVPLKTHTLLRELKAGERTS